MCGSFICDNSNGRDRVCFQLFIILCRIRITTRVHRNQSTHSKMDKENALRLHWLDSAAVHCTIISDQFLCLLHHWFGWRCFWIPVWCMVITALHTYYWTKCSHFYSFTTQRYPFDTKNPMGFLAANVILYVIVLVSIIILKCIVLLGVSTMPLLFPLTDDIKCELNAIQQSLKDKRHRSKMAKPLSQFVQFHSDTRQLSGNFSQMLRHSQRTSHSLPFQIGTWIFPLLAKHIDGILLLLRPWDMQSIAIGRDENGDLSFVNEFIRLYFCPMEKFNNFQPFSSHL